MRKKHYILMVLMLVPVLTLTACGGGSTTGEPVEIEAGMIPPESTVFTITSSAFENGEPIPDTHSYYGGNKSPQLSWSGAPEGTVSFVLIMEDPDTPAGVFTHWMVYNIPADVLELAEGQPIIATLDNGASQGRNGFGGLGYDGPAPPAGTTYRYSFRLYALDTTLDLAAGSMQFQLVNAMQNHILGEAELMGTSSA